MRGALREIVVDIKAAAGEVGLEVVVSMPDGKTDAGDGFEGIGRNMRREADENMKKMRGMRGAGGHATSEFSGKFEEIERTMGNDIKEMMDEMRKMRF